MILSIIYGIIVILNSHFGTNLSNQESDNTEKSIKNFISKKYEKIIDYFYELYNNFICEAVPPQKVQSIDISDLTGEKFVLLTNNYRTPLVIKRFCLDTDAVKH